MLDPTWVTAHCPQQHMAARKSQGRSNDRVTQGIRGMQGSMPAETVAWHGTAVAQTAEDPGTDI